MSAKPILEINHLSKQLREIKAVDNLSMIVYRKDVYGFLGPNGSGKSTSIRMILSLLRPDAGEINIFGLPLTNHRKKILSRVGAFIEKPDFYDYLSARKNLEILSQYSNIPPKKWEISKILEMVGLSDRGHSKVKTYSKGMKQRLGIAQTLLHDPELLILDEPASGLDPSGNRDIRNLIRFLNEEKGKTIILSSHNLNEIELVANRMLIINKGRKIVEGNVRELLSKQSNLTNFQLDKPQDSIALLQNSSLEVYNLIRTESGIQLQCKKKIIPEINSLLVSKDIKIESIRVEQNLEDYFLNLT